MPFERKLVSDPLSITADDLQVTGDLDLYLSEVTSLPDNLTVGGTIDLRGSKITSVPNNLTVGGNLYLEFSPLAKKYTDAELKKMLPNVKGMIYTSYNQL